eukprot:Em0015g244a
MMGGFRLQMAHELSCGVLYALQSDRSSCVSITIDDSHSGIQDDTAKHGQSDCDDIEIDQTDQLGDDGDMDDEDDADENPNDIFALIWGKDHYFKYLPRLKRMPYTEEQCPFEREFIRKVVKEMEIITALIAIKFNVSPFGSIGSEIGKHGELKELETAIMGTYRQRVCDLNLQTEDVNPKTSAGKQLLSKFLRAQTMQDLAMALSATKDEKWMAIHMKLRLPEMEEFTVGDELTAIVLFFEKLLRSIFQEADTSSGLSRINELSKDATLDAAVGLVRAVANAVQIIDGKMIMGSIASTLNSLYHQTEATLESVKPYLAIDGTMGGVVG